jgi:hypothetical protein
VNGMRPRRYNEQQSHQFVHHGGILTTNRQHRCRPPGSVSDRLLTPAFTSISSSPDVAGGFVKGDLVVGQVCSRTQFPVIFGHNLQAPARTVDFRGAR